MKLTTALAVLLAGFVSALPEPVSEPDAPAHATLVRLPRFAGTPIPKKTLSHGWISITSHLIIRPSPIPERYLTLDTLP